MMTTANTTDVPRILLVEDSLPQAQLLRRWLELPGGLDITHTDNGLEGARLAATRDWDLVISDVELPEMNGLDVLRHSKIHHPLVPTLLMTAHERIEFAIGALQLKADDFIVKPLKKDSFTAKVHSLLEKGRERKAAEHNVVLAIGAHPDDVEIGCGGILVKHRENGDDVIILTLCSGHVGGDADVRAQESHLAARMLGSELVMGDLTDTMIPDGAETIRLIEEVIRRVKPNVIYTHSANDGHQDHRAVHRSTMVAARGIPNVFCYQSPSTTIEFCPSRFVEVGDQLDSKIRLLACYRTQTAKRPYLTEEMIRMTAGYWGRFAGYKSVEPLEVIRSVA